jgi:D-glycero-D-manno-heptose 1,7-bisphosphate phosphatase
MKKLLLLDRDGTITQNKARPGDYINSPDEIELMPGVFELLQQYVEDDWQMAMLSNQGGVEKGYISLDKCVEGFKHTMALTGNRITTAWFCPASYGTGNDGVGIRIEHIAPNDYAWTRCQAFRTHGYRKPHPGMAFAAVDWFKIQQGDIVLYVGDRPEDETMAQNAGIAFMAAEQWRVRSPISAEAWAVL